jgi:hypothetical protein
MALVLWKCQNTRDIVILGGLLFFGKVTNNVAAGGIPLYLLGRVN